MYILWSVYNSISHVAVTYEVVVAVASSSISLFEFSAHHIAEGHGALSTADPDHTVPRAGSGSAAAADSDWTVPRTGSGCAVALC